MYTAVLVFGIIIIIMVLYLIMTDWYTFSDKTFCLMFASLFIVPAVATMIVTVIVDPEIQTKKTKTEIISLEDNSTLSGSFVLGSGKLKNETYFYYYYKNKHQSWSLGKKKANDCSIKMTADSTSYLVKIVRKTQNPWTISPNRCLRYEFVVPENTIVNNFKIDNHKK